MRQLALAAFIIFGFVSGAYAKDILLGWTELTERIDGTTITKLDRYNLHYSINNVVQEPIEIEATSTDYLLVDVEDGLYVFQLAGVEGGEEGEKTAPLALPVGLALVKAVDNFSGVVQ